MRQQVQRQRSQPGVGAMLGERRTDARPRM